MVCLVQTRIVPVPVAYNVFFCINCTPSLVHYGKVWVSPINVINVCKAYKHKILCYVAFLEYIPENIYPVQTRIRQGNTRTCLESNGYTFPRKVASIIVNTMNNTLKSVPVRQHIHPVQSMQAIM